MTESDIAKLAEALSHRNGKKNGATDWGTLGTWAGVILALVFGIGGVVGAAMAIAMKNLDERTSGIQSRELANAFDTGKLTERIDNHGKALIGLDTTLQREMRQLDEAMIVQLEGLDRRLQDEIARASKVGSDDRDVLRKVMDEMRAYQDRSRELNARQDERMRALEREFYGDTETIQ